VEGRRAKRELQGSREIGRRESDSNTGRLYERADHSRLTGAGDLSFPLARHGMGTRSLASLMVFRWAHTKTRSPSWPSREHSEHWPARISTGEQREYSAMCHNKLIYRAIFSGMNFFYNN
jgi:hypothetical protein